MLTLLFLMVCLLQDQDRIAGMDLMPDLIRECAKLKKKIFLYGSTREILEKIEKKAKKKYRNIDRIWWSI